MLDGDLDRIEQVYALYEEEFFCPIPYDVETVPMTRVFNEGMLQILTNGVALRDDTAKDWDA